MADGDMIRVNVEIRIDAQGTTAGYGSLTVREDFQIPAAGFTELSAIMGQFHDLAQKVKGENARDEDCPYYQAHSDHHAACCAIGRRRASRT